MSWVTVHFIGSASRSVSRGTGDSPPKGMILVADAPHTQARTPGASTRDDWKNTVLAGLANHHGPGSIGAGAAGLSLWASMFDLSSSFVGVIGAFSSNAISAGVGALVGGRLCDLLGRKKIYQWDMLFYAFGMLFLVLAVHPWRVVFGFLIVGLAVGADIPASWTIHRGDGPG